MYRASQMTLNKFEIALNFTKQLGVKSLWFIFKE